MLFDKFREMADFQAQLAARDVKPFGAVTERIISATEGIVEGREVILAGTNNYLGLSYDQRCIDAAREAVSRWGTGTTGSRLANGSFAEHEALEREMAAFYGVDHAIVFSTGYSATMGMCATLAGPGDTILLDADSHASIYAGVTLSGANIIRYKHNNPEDLAKRLRRLGDDTGRALIIAEGIYSMYGDIAPLREIAEVKREYGGYLFLDEAHSMGTLGDTGRGAAQAAGVEDDVDFFAGTFSKSLGAIGGFCVSRHPQMEAIRYCIRAYIFTASSSPSVIASTREALRIVQAEPQLREKLWDNAHRLYDGLKALGLPVSPAASPVIAIEMEDRSATIDCWKALLQAGVYVNLVVPPASPSNNYLLRNSVSAAHSTQQIDAIIAAYAGLIDAGLVTPSQAA
ncbi:MAG: aminotransferase class I/II-fold pyridoxal phosphate-dependent enzyme [Halioglobus sp.]|nr:aminotransferase class I/II-fold pyridoxal phosphate-dependent enzyme [Halioglobus sp.]